MNEECDAPIRPMAKMEPRDGGIFVVVAEWGDQGPIVLETEGEFSSREQAYERARKMDQTHRFVRYAVARLVYDSGNMLAMKDMERMQK